MYPPFDAPTLMDRVDGDVEFLEETVEILEEDIPLLLDQLGQANASRNAEALVGPAHAIKGMLANFCAEPAEAAARTVEMLGRTNQLADSEAALDALRRETERFLKALQSFLRNRKHGRFL